MTQFALTLMLAAAALQMTLVATAPMSNKRQSGPQSISIKDLMDNVKQNQYQNLTTAVEITCGMYKQFERLNSSTIKYNENLTKSFELLNATLTASYNYLLEVVRLELNQSLDMERNNASAFVELHQKWQGALVELRNKGFKSFLHPIFNISDYILMGLEN